MRKRDSGRAVAALVVAAVTLSSCSARRHHVGKEHFEQSLARARSERAVTDGIEKQLMPAEAERKAAEGAPLAPGEPIWIRSGKTRILQLRGNVRRVSIGNPDLAGIVVLGPRSVMVNAKELPKAGGEAAAPRAAGVVTGRTLTPEPHMSETTLVVWDGPGEAPYIHTLFIADFIDRQVMLEVTVAELNRTAMEDHGLNFRNMANSFVSAYFMGGGVGPASGGQVPPGQNQPLLPIATSDAAPVYAFNLPKTDITAFVQALQTEGLATILAQPKLLAMSGQNAVFQVGGEIPIRIATGFSADIEFKPFGTLINFIPQVSDEGDIMLTVTPEVSQPDFNSPVEGIPSFRTRRASTSTRLRNGETLVIGGLLQTNRTESVSGVPYLQNLPLVGYIFRNTHYESQVTELMVIITPHLVQALPPGQELALPTDRGPLTSGEMKTKRDPAEVTRPRVPGMP